MLQLLITLIFGQINECLIEMRFHIKVTIDNTHELRAKVSMHLLMMESYSV